MAQSIDWYPHSQGAQREMFANVGAKIAGYTAKYNLSAPFVAEVQLICSTFITAYDKVAQNRATAKQLTSWFENILKGSPAGDPVPPAPVFQNIMMPDDAFIGIEARFRELVAFIKANPAFDAADGEDLMIVPTASLAPIDETTLAPDLKLAVVNEMNVAASYKKAGFDGLELQWRKSGEALWQFADKTTEGTVEFTPPDAVPGAPEKFEFRGIYLKKNKRIGQWSPIYSVTVG